MNILNEHEIFEIEVLEKLKNAKLLEPLVFGGGTMLRLCYGLNRYSVDLDLWFIKKVNVKEYFAKLKQFLKKDYEITDAQNKFYTLLVEIRKAGHGKKLKIEIRKEVKDCDYNDMIAFSRFTTKQVALRVHAMEQCMKNKIEAALNRKEIRDCFDIEFLLRRGVSLTASRDKLTKLKSVVLGFKDSDFKVKLAAVLDAEDRAHYLKDRFTYLLSKLI
jgi:predicted nucleotidyltransferase component of viral defense system